jgi:outer membrane usher protein
MGDLGAFSIDVTRAKALLKKQQASKGQSWRVRYSKDFAGPAPTFAGGLSLQQQRVLHPGRHHGVYTRSTTGLHRSSAARTEATIDQTLPEGWGSVTLSLVKETYWSQSQDMTSMSVSYNNSWHGVSYSLSYSMNKNTHDSDETGVRHKRQPVLAERLGSAGPLDA